MRRIQLQFTFCPDFFLSFLKNSVITFFPYHPLFTRHTPHFVFWNFASLLLRHPHHHDTFTYTALLDLRASSSPQDSFPNGSYPFLACSSLFFYSRLKNFIWNHGIFAHHVVKTNLFSGCSIARLPSSQWRGTREEQSETHMFPSFMYFNLFKRRLYVITLHGTHSMTLLSSSSFIRDNFNWEEYTRFWSSRITRNENKSSPHTKRRCSSRETADVLKMMFNVSSKASSCVSTSWLPHDN